jgi:phosphatidylglycerol lysyltransferase
VDSDDLPKAASSPGRVGRLIPAWTTLLGLVLFGFAVWWLHRSLSEYRWHDIVQRMQAIPRSALSMAALLTIASYACLTLYDVLGVHLVGASIRYRRLATISFMAYGIGHNVGMNTLSGGAIRFRAYSALGLNGKQIATIIALGTGTFGLGAATLLGASLLSQGALSVSILRVPASVVAAVGAALLAAVAGYLLIACTRRAPIRLASLEFSLPRPRLAFAQVALACTDLMLSASILYVLLPPQSTVGLLGFVGLYIIAIAAGVISTVPGGVGVFESFILLLLPLVPRDRLLGSLLAYRAIYYFIPFAIALALLGLHELSVNRRRLGRVLGLVRTWIGAVTPQLAALAVFAAGAVLLFSGATPGLEPRMVFLRHFVPLSVLELSHLVGSAVGVGLLVLANGLYRRLDAAWWLTLWLLCAGILVSLLKGFDYEEATILSIVAALLASAHSRFPRRASLIEQRFSLSWMLALVFVLGTAAWLVSFSYRHVPYANDLWWQFAFEAQAPRSLRGLLLALILVAAYGLWRLLRPAKSVFAVPSETDLVQAQQLIAASEDTTGNLALLADKNLMFNAARTAFIMYQVSGRSWIAMGDPVGPESEREPLAWEFVESCDGMAASPVFYQVTPENLPIYVDLGLSLSKLGEEARVPLEGFSLDGAARADLRQTHRRAVRDGAEFAIVPRDGVAALMPQLQEISDAWLAAKSGAEKGFSLGYFDADYLARFDCAVVRSGGRIVAFANIWRAGATAELSVDLMRYSAGAPKGVIDFLLIECMLWGKAQGYRWFNLGMAPLSGLEEHPLAPAWHKLGRLVTRYGENLYHFDGLRKYKEKFQPVWRPRYLAAPSGLSMAGSLLDVTNLISGGVSKILTK